MTYQQIYNAIEKYLHPTQCIIMNYLYHSPKDCELTTEILNLLNFEYYDEKTDEIGELPIIGHCFLESEYLYPRLYIEYMTYDHHNNPRLISVLVNIEDKWIIEETAITWKHTKYNNISDNRFDILHKIF